MAELSQPAMTRAETTEALVERLAASARPVTPLRPPMVRAALFLAAFGAVSAAAILLFANMPVFEMRARHGELVVELAGTLGTGILATIAAFHLSLPDRTRLWALLPLPGLAVWLAGSGAGCYRDWIERRGDTFSLGESGHCLLFIAGFGVPLMVALLLMLRRAKPLSPTPVAMTGGLAAAALAAFLLQFFHPFSVTVMDLAMHALGVLIVIGVCGTAGRRTLETAGAV